MAKITVNQKQKLINRLKKIDIKSEKEILNVKISDLKKLTEIENGKSFSGKDIELLWLIQDAITQKKILDFLSEDSEV